MTQRLGEPAGLLRQVSWNAFVYGTGQALSRTVTVIMLVLLVRYLSIEDVGRFSVLLTLIGIFQVLATAGMDRLAVRAVALDPPAGWREMPQLSGLALVAGGLGSVVLASWAAIWGPSEGSWWLVAVVGAAVLPSVLAEVLDAGLQGAQRMASSALGHVGSMATWLAIVVVTMHRDLGLTGVFVGLLAGQTLRAALLVRACGIRAVWPRLAVSRWRTIVVEASPFALSAVLGILQFRLDLLLVAWMKGAAVAALYTAALKFVEIAVYAALIGFVALGPAIARLHSTPESLRAAYLKFLGLACLIAVPTALGVFAHAGPLLRFVFSDQYADAVPVLHVLAWVMAIYVIHVPGMSVLMFGQRIRPLITVSLVSMLSSVAFNLLLIPLAGAQGAAGAALGSISLGAALTVHFIRRMLPVTIGDIARTCLPSLIAGGVMLSVDLAVLGGVGGPSRVLGGLVVYLAAGLLAYRTLRGGRIIETSGLDGSAPAAIGAGRADVDVSLIIVNYRTEDYVSRCIDSLPMGHGPLRLEVLLIDNSPGRLRDVAARRAHVRLVENSENVGFARACNQGFRAAGGRAVVLLNPDTELRPGALAVLVRTLEADPGIGAVAACLLNSDGTLQPSCRPLFSPWLALLDCVGISSFYPKPPLFGRRDGSHVGGNQPRDVGQPMGACLCIRRETLDDVGLLDERFFVYFEDVDWCLRAWRRGWRIVYTPEAKLVHHEGRSAARDLDRARMAFYRSKLAFCRKHFGGAVLGVLIVLLLVEIALRRAAWGAIASWRGTTKGAEAHRTSYRRAWQTVITDLRTSP